MYLHAQALVLDGNAFKAWADVAACAGFPSLQRLSLSDNVLADVQGPQPGRGLLQHALPACLPAFLLAGHALPTCHHSHQARMCQLDGRWRSSVICERVAGSLLTVLLGVSGQLGSLDSLQLAGNRLAAWEDVNRLDAFPGLQDLRLTGNPCVEGQDTVTSRLEVCPCAACFLFSFSPFCSSRPWHRNRAPARPGATCMLGSKC